MLQDDYQLEVAKYLQRIYEQIQDYKPPEIPKQSEAEKAFAKWLPFLPQPPKPKLDPSKRLKGLYIHGSVGGGKTLLMDMFFECCETVIDLVYILKLFLALRCKLSFIFRSRIKNVYTSIRS